MGSASEESSAHVKKQLKGCNKKEPLDSIPTEGSSHCRLNPPFMPKEFNIEGSPRSAPSVEHQFIPSAAGMHQHNKQEIAESKSLLAASRCEEISISLQLGEPEQKRRKQSDSLLIAKDRN